MTIAPIDLPPSLGVLFLGLAVLSGCERAPRATVLPVTAAPATGSPVEATATDEVARLDAELAKLGSLNGATAGRLLEKKGDAQAAAGELESAAMSYDAAAGAYNRSPEATTMPQIHSDQAREKARKVRERLGAPPVGGAK